MTRTSPEGSKPTIAPSRTTKSSRASYWIGAMVLVIGSVLAVEMLTTLLLDDLTEEGSLHEVMINGGVLIGLLFPIFYFAIIGPILKALKQARQIEARYASVIDSAGDALLILTADFRIVGMNDVAKAMFGEPPAEQTEEEARAFLSRLGAQSVLCDALQAAVKGQADPNHAREAVILDRHGKGFPAALRSGLVQFQDDTGHRVNEIVLLIRDISPRMAAVQKLQDHRNLLEALIEAIPAPIFFKDGDARYMGCNKSFEEFIGVKRENIIDRTVYDVAPKELADKYAEADQALYDTGGFQVYDTQVESSSGQRMDVVFHKSVFEQGPDHKPGIVGVMTDITHQKDMERQLTHMTLHDPLTGLPNRPHFMRHLTQALSRAHRHNRRLAVFFLDLDGFKEVNDRHGHDLGDRVLCDVAKHLQGVMRESDFIARLAGDEFAVMAEELAEKSDVDLIANKLCQAVRNGEGENAAISLSVSIGIAFYPDHGDRAEGLLLTADQAMYQAKARGKNTHFTWNKDGLKADQLK